MSAINDRDPFNGGTIGQWVGYIAKVIREKSAEEGLTPCQFATKQMTGLVPDDTAVYMFVAAVARIAAEDERAGGGPLRMVQ